MSFNSSQGYRRSDSREERREHRDLYVVNPGDTVDSIAAMFGVTENDLLSHNNMANKDLVYPGQQIAVPSRGGDGGRDHHGGQRLPLLRQSPFPVSYLTYGLRVHDARDAYARIACVE